MTTNTFACVLMYVVSLLSLDVFAAQLRSCSPGTFCPIDANCTNNTSLCTVMCPINIRARYKYHYNYCYGTVAWRIDRMQQGNYLTGNCERIPDGTDHWMDSTLYEVFILSNQSVNTPILNIAFISTDQFQTDGFTYNDLVTDITFTLIGSCPYFYFTNMLKEEISFENYYDLYVPDDIEGVTLALAETVPPDDYEMEVTVTNGDTVLQRRNIIVHVRDVPPCTTGPETFVDFSSTDFTVLKSAGSLVVTLVSSGIIPSQSLIIGIIAIANNSSKFPAAGGVDFTPGRYNVTFTTGATTATTSIPIITGGSDGDIKQFSLRLFIDGVAYQQCVFSGNVSTAAVFVTPDPNITRHPMSGRILVGLSHTLICSAIGSGTLRFSWERSFNGSSWTTVSDDNTTSYTTDTTLAIREYMYRCNVSNEGGSVVSNNATVIVYDIMVRFTQNQYTGSEAAQFVIVNLELVGGTFPTSFDVTVTSSEQSPVSAEGGVDFNTTTLTATFASGMTMSNVSVPVIVDDILEEDEEFDLTLSIPSSLGPAITAGDRDMATAIITDSIIVEFTSGQYVGSESSGFIEVIVRITGGSSSTPIIVTVTPSVQSPVSAMGSGVDFNPNPLTITINAGATDGRANVSVTCDNVTEGLETFDMKLTITSSSSGVTLGRDTCEGQIIDSTVEMSFNQSSYGVMEDDGTVNIMIVLSQTSSVQFEVMISTTNVTAVAGEDYNGNPITVNIPAGVTMQPVTIKIIDNNIVECNELFKVTMVSVTTCGVTIGSNRISEVMIRDDDNITLRFNQSVYRVDENVESATLVLVIDNVLSTSITLKIEEINNNMNTATECDDYIPGPYNVIFPAGVTSVSFNVPIIDDGILENDEQIFLKIDSSSLPSCGLTVTVVDPSQATLTILNDDFVKVRFNQSTYSVDENGGLIQPVLVLSHRLSTDIKLRILGISATANSDDYAPGPYIVRFPAGETSVSFNISITNDDELEREEIFYLKIRSRLLPENVTDGRPNRVAVNILDDDNITLKFSQSEYSVNEDMKLVKIVVVLNNPISTAITLKIDDRDSTASRNVDYAPGPYDVVIPVGETSVSFNVSITDDKMLEGNEFFTLSINSLHDHLPNVTVTNRQARVTIVDDDRATIHFSESKYIIDLNASVVQPVLILNISSSVNISIKVKIRGNSNSLYFRHFTGNEPFPVLLPAKQTMASFNISVVDIMKTMRKIKLGIVKRSLPYYVTCDSNCNTKVIMK